MHPAPQERRDPSFHSHGNGRGSRHDGIPLSNNKDNNMLMALTLVVAFYVLLAALPADQLPLFRRIAAIPVAVLMFIGFVLLAATVDGRQGVRAMVGEVREVLSDVTGFFRDLFTLR